MFLSNKCFIYDGTPSNFYGLRFAWIEESPDTQMSSEKTYTYIKNRASNSFNISKSDYENPLEFDAEIIASRVLTEREVRNVYKRFFNKNKFCKLRFSDTSDEGEYLNCVLTNPERIEGGMGSAFGVVGFRIKIVCDAPWGWTDETEIKYAFKPSSKTDPDTLDAIWITYSDDTSKEAEFTLYNNSDSPEYVYPEVVVTTIDEGYIDSESLIGNYSFYNCAGCYYKNNCVVGDSPNKALIINQSDSDSRSTCIFWGEETGGSGVSMSIRMDATSGLIRENSASTINRISNTNKNFIRLLPGENKFKVQNISEITFKYKEARVLV